MPKLQCSPSIFEGKILVLEVNFVASDNDKISFSLEILCLY
jgi:hypothetical protein